MQGEIHITHKPRWSFIFTVSVQTYFLGNQFAEEGVVKCFLQKHKVSPEPGCQMAITLILWQILSKLSGLYSAYSQTNVSMQSSTQILISYSEYHIVNTVD